MTADHSSERSRHHSLRGVWLMVSFSFRADPLAAALLCIVMPTYYLSPAIGALAVKSLIDTFTASSETNQGSSAALFWSGGLVALAVLAATVSLKLEVYLSHTLEKKVSALVQRELAEMLVRLPGIEHYERADYLDEVKQLRDQAGDLGSGLLSLLNLFGLICQVLVVCALLGAQSPLLLLLPLFAIPYFVAAGVGNRLNRQGHERTAQTERRLHATVKLSTDIPAAREIRLFGLASDLRRRRRDLANEVDATHGRVQIQTSLLNLAGSLFFALGYAGAVTLVLSSAVNGGLTAGDVALTIVLAGQVRDFIGDLNDGVKFTWGISIVAARMDWLETYEQRHLPAPGQCLSPRTIRHGISLRDVSFTYPGADGSVLNNLTVDLPAGAVVALVGDNGAGKTSLVKLLLGFYRPTAGQILLDETDLCDVEPNAWRGRITGVFQDYRNYEFLAHESVGLGDVTKISDDAAVQGAVERAGAGPIVGSLPNGLRTQLGAGWKEGVDLSGGQWQRMALARAQMSTDPLLQILDEPTTAMDAHAEYELFAGFAKAAEDMRRRGGVTLLVTHRFSTVRMADVIIVLEDGNLREIGSHDELMRAEGLYAELFTLQAAAYK